jgi:hypothetical protein
MTGGKCRCDVQLTESFVACWVAGKYLQELSRCSTCVHKLDCAADGHCQLGEGGVLTIPKPGQL